MRRFARHADEDQHFDTDLAQAAADSLGIVLAIEHRALASVEVYGPRDVDNQRDPPVVGLSFVPRDVSGAYGHWEIGIVRPGATRPHFAHITFGL